jgi:TetR/AcrR family transcriptional regulator
VTSTGSHEASRVARAAVRSPVAQRSRQRVKAQSKGIIDAARRLVEVKGDTFTTEELARESGIALQTFYNYFNSKDELLVAVIADINAEAIQLWRKEAEHLPDPIARLRHYVFSSMGTLDGSGYDLDTARFIVSAHWRLHRVLPEELAAAERPLVDRLLAEIKQAQAAGQLTSNADPEVHAWLLAELVRSVYCSYAFAPGPTGSMATVKEDLWQFGLAALGGNQQAHL